MNKICVKSIAKINFGLRVLSKREDGFHNLQTLFFPINGLYDNISFEKSEILNFNSNISSLNDDSNLIIKTVRLLQNELGQKLNVKIDLLKQIPIGAGLGGGSSNAASTLLALNKLFELNLSNNELIKFALQLGSDVPFFINPVYSIATSRGEILNPTDLNFNKYILLVNPGIHISTKEAFSNIKNIASAKTDYTSIIINGSIDFAMAKNNIFNDFEDYVFYKFPEIAAIKETLIENGALFAQMSGTGSTVYGIFDNNNETANLAANLFRKNYFCFLNK